MDQKQKSTIKNDVKLSSPLFLSPKTQIKNRFFKSAMSEQLGTKEHGPDERLNRLYHRWAQGGVGLAVTGNVMIDRTALGEGGNVALEDERHLDAFKAWAQAGTQNDTQLWMQLNHPGKQIPRYLGGRPVAPSAIPFEGDLGKIFLKPHALSEAEILEVITKFARGAALARKAGFTGVQMHGAHGYLISQFLSPRHNQRQDRWGGSLENRMRFVIETYRAIRSAVGADFPVGVKLNSADFQRGGFTREESMEVVQTIAQEGINLIEISGGTYESPAMTRPQAGGKKLKESTIKREAYFLEYAEQVRELTNTPLVVTGGFRSSAAMQSALSSGATDMIGVARPMAVEPNLPQLAIDDPDYSIVLNKVVTGIKKIDQMGFVELLWFQNQLVYMGAGRSPKKNLQPLVSLAKTLLGAGWSAFTKQRT